MGSGKIGSLFPGISSLDSLVDNVCADAILNICWPLLFDPARSAAEVLVLISGDLVRSAGVVMCIGSS